MDLMPETTIRSLKLVDAIQQKHISPNRSKTIDTCREFWFEWLKFGLHSGH